MVPKGATIGSRPQTPSVCLMLHCSHVPIHSPAGYTVLAMLKASCCGCQGRTSHAQACCPATRHASANTTTGAHSRTVRLFMHHGSLLPLRCRTPPSCPTHSPSAAPTRLPTAPTRCTQSSCKACASWIEWPSPAPGGRACCARCARLCLYRLQACPAQHSIFSLLKCLLVRLLHTYHRPPTHPLSWGGCGCCTALIGPPCPPCPPTRLQAQQHADPADRHDRDPICAGPPQRNHLHAHGRHTALGADQHSRRPQGGTGGGWRPPLHSRGRACTA